MRLLALLALAPEASALVATPAAALAARAAGPVAARRAGAAPVADLSAFTHALAALPLPGFVGYGEAGSNDLSAYNGDLGLQFALVVLFPTVVTIALTQTKAKDMDDDFFGQ